MSTDLTYSDATALAEAIRTGRTTSVEVVQAHLVAQVADNPLAPASGQGGDGIGKLGSLQGADVVQTAPEQQLRQDLLLGQFGQLRLELRRRGSPALERRLRARVLWLPGRWFPARWVLV